MLVAENRPHHDHPREGPFPDDIKPEAAVPGQVAAGNRRREARQQGRLGWAWHSLLVLQGGAGELVPGQAIQGSLEDTLVGLHGLWGEGHRGKGM